MMATKFGTGGQEILLTKIAFTTGRVACILSALNSHNRLWVCVWDLVCSGFSLLTLALTSTLTSVVYKHVTNGPVLTVTYKHAYVNNAAHVGKYLLLYLLSAFVEDITRPPVVGRPLSSQQ